MPYTRRILWNDDEKPEVIDPPQNEDMMDVGESVNDPAQTALKPNVTVSSSVRELLECPVCLNAMYPPIHQVCCNAFLVICDHGAFMWLKLAIPETFFWF